MSLYNELKRRNVIRVGVAYIVAAWLVIQVVETIFPAFGKGCNSLLVDGKPCKPRGGFEVMNINRPVALIENGFRRRG
jgi:hypothetical protein